MIRTARAMIDALLVLVVICVLPFAWLMRDGMGPSAVDSSGLSAAVKCFWTFGCGPLVIALACASIWLHLRIKKKMHNQSLQGTRENARP